jgi:RNA polymerase sigma factor (TIGR02999 family)
MGDPDRSAALLPLVYAALRKLARAKMARERPGHTLQPTALVHEAYLRLEKDGAVRWDGRGHFFAAAAEAMRRILVERARRARTAKRGGHLERTPYDEAAISDAVRDEKLLALDAALEKLERRQARQAQVVKLRYFAGLTIEETARAAGVSPATVKLDWSLARAWLEREMALGSHARGPAAAPDQGPPSDRRPARGSAA